MAGHPTHQQLWRALYSALGKVSDSRLVILTTAGDPSSHAYKLLERARTSPEWLVNEVPGPAPWIAASDLAEDRAELPAWEYDRLHRNIWTASADRLVRPDDLARCVREVGDLPPRHAVRYVITVDVGLVHDRTAVAICHAEPQRRSSAMRPTESADDDPYGFRRWQRSQRGPVDDARIVLDRLQVWEGTRDRRVSLATVEDWIVGASRLYNGAAVYYDPLQMERLAESLRDFGIRTQRVTFSLRENSERAILLHKLIAEALLSLPDDVGLLDELAHVRLVESSPGVYRLDHDRNRHDDRAVALAMAAQVLEGGGRTRAGPLQIQDRRLAGRR